MRLTRRFRGRLPRRLGESISVVAGPCNPQVLRFEYVGPVLLSLGRPARERRQALARLVTPLTSRAQILPVHGIPFLLGNSTVDTHGMPIQPRPFTICI